MTPPAARCGSTPKASRRSATDFSRFPSRPLTPLRAWSIASRLVNEAIVVALTAAAQAVVRGRSNTRPDVRILRYLDQFADVAAARALAPLAYPNILAGVTPVRA